MKQQNTLQIKKIRKTATIPSKGSKEAAGLDLYYDGEGTITISPGEIKTIPTGIIAIIPNGYEGQIRPRSGLAAKHEITVLNSPGTIDSDYTGEIKVILINHGKKTFEVKDKMRIAQMVISEYSKFDIIEAETIIDTPRGEKGFGSTGY